MPAKELVLFCSLLWILRLTAGKEFTITCFKSEECVLPCRFRSDGKGARIMWYKKKTVVSCTRYGNTSFVVGHNSPADKYKNRTGLYADQVLEGNATLLLRNVTPHDEGKYFCITMTEPSTDESGVISLVVKAPVEDVDIELGDDEVVCRAEGVYPAPTLSWATEPPTEAKLLQNKTRIQRTHLGFYDIEGSLKAAGNGTVNRTFICQITSDSSKKTAHLRQEASIQVSPGNRVKIPCSLPLDMDGLQSYNLTWRFRRSEPILSMSVSGLRSQVKVWDQWKAHVLDSGSAVASRSLKLQGLTSEHQGSYTCEVSAPGDTYITQTDVTVTEDSQRRYLYIGILVMGYFLFMSYGMVALLTYEMKKLQDGEEVSTLSVQECLSLEAIGEVGAEAEGGR